MQKRTELQENVRQGRLEKFQALTGENSTLERTHKDQKEHIRFLTSGAEDVGDGDNPKPVQAAAVASVRRHVASMIDQVEKRREETAKLKRKIELLHNKKNELKDESIRLDSDISRSGHATQALRVQFRDTLDSATGILSAEADEITTMDDVTTAEAVLSTKLAEEDYPDPAMDSPELEGLRQELETTIALKQRLFLTVQEYRLDIERLAAKTRKLRQHAMELYRRKQVNKYKHQMEIKQDNLDGTVVKMSITAPSHKGANKFL